MSKVCNGLINEDYKYHLSGDCLEFCLCVVTKKRCMGVVVVDSDDQSSQFFSRGKNVVVEKLLNKCPLYGGSSEVFQTLIKDRMEKELNETLKKLK